jgi:hypothetical protein
MAGTHIGVDCNYGIDRKIQMARCQRLQTVWIGKIDEPGDFGILGGSTSVEAFNLKSLTIIIFQFLCQVAGTAITSLFILFLWTIDWKLWLPRS